MPASKDQTGATFVSSPSRSVVDNLEAMAKGLGLASKPIQMCSYLTKMRERSHQNLWHCEVMKRCLKINAM